MSWRLSLFGKHHHLLPLIRGQRTLQGVHQEYKYAQIYCVCTNIHRSSALSMYGEYLPCL